MARMKIFNTLEEEAFESPPEFNSGERKRFFSLSLLLKESQASLRTPTNKVCFLVAAGYFKARRKFFARQFRSTDIEYVARQIGVNLAEVHVDAYSKGTYARHQRVILNYFGCSRSTKRRRPSLLARSRRSYASSYGPSWSWWESSSF